MNNPDLDAAVQEARRSFECAVTILKEDYYANAIHSKSKDMGSSTGSARRNILSLATMNTMIDVHTDSIQSLEEALENIAYTWDINTTNASTRSTRTCSSECEYEYESLQKEILETISLHYKELAFIIGENQETLKRSDEDVADVYLDWAIACKRSNLMDDCVKAHICRMNICCTLKHTDAMRLLGISRRSQDVDVDVNVDVNVKGFEISEDTRMHNEEDSNNITCETTRTCIHTIEEIDAFGIFESELVKKFITDASSDIAINTERYYYHAHRPTKDAIEMGKRVRTILHECRYNLLNCSKILHHVISSESDERDKYPSFDPNRIYSANDFVNHRVAAWNEYTSLPGEEDLKIVASLFLFGLSLEQSFVADVLGDDNVSDLMEAGLLTIHAADENLVVGQIQIYPLDTDTFEFETQKSPTAETLYFMTDWSIESLRLPRNAIMSIGYDSLELVALSSGKNIFPGSRNENCRKPTRTLDLCSGCGIQGIFSAKRALTLRNRDMDSHNHQVTHVEELICADLNERACHFITANACLNDLDIRSDTSCSTIDILAVESNVYEPMYQGGMKSSTHHTNTCIMGTFRTILSNPPFVAVPFAKSQGSLSPALFSAGGNFDGMDVLRDILKRLFSVLDVDGNEEEEATCTGAHTACLPTMLMVTEIPNVEDGCEMLERMLQVAIQEPSCVKVAYIEQDVETVEEYANEREVEAGYHVQGRDWTPASSNDFHIRNRALVLISISRATGGIGFRKLVSFVGSSPLVDFSEADEEDLFLTREGVDFARKHLL